MKEITGLNGMFRWTIVREGRIIGTWQRTLRREAVAFEFDFFERPAEGAQEDVMGAASRYAEFIGLSADLGKAFAGVSRSA